MLFSKRSSFFVHVDILRMGISLSGKHNYHVESMLGSICLLVASARIGTE